MINLDLNGKKIYIFCPSFFGYDEDIKKEIESLGAKVSLFDERVFTNILGKALIRLNFRSIIKYFIEYFYTKNLLRNIEDVDYVLLINPETITPSILQKAKYINPKVKVITYMWDSFKNKQFSKEYIKESDSFFTFDPQDAAEYKVEFLPLFFVHDYESINIPSDYKYDFNFIGTVHSQRFSIVKNITKNSNAKFLFFYCPSKFVYIYKKYIKKELSGIKFNDASFSAMKRDDIIQVVQESKAIIDISHPSQVGLTMRSIEMLGARKKIITTNPEILNYDFYHPNNILCIDQNTTPYQIDEFIKLQYHELPSDIYKDYNINSWIKKLFI
ncbi:lipopolysaccharide biosynthesis protein [Photobacterium damselae subsp. damselae]|uniref:lipopolysaccharide biosynthesis protein n=1 Tax=Photobacterium damselae TaxID=38293 RepID=UPI001594D7AA|nr:lipopolysaccharide biosynthesis protein [Photobacterium damselae]NVH52666.1 lipopolysaccharide biosynthesis protein [Photobacterium damselae subsp. damselae]NVO81654.1 lipopolysaccharide biosynthesis protein [Photobacterium damselae subsp. damselae]